MTPKPKVPGLDSRRGLLQPSNAPCASNIYTSVTRSNQLMIYGTNFPKPSWRFVLALCRKQFRCGPPKVLTANPALWILCRCWMAPEEAHDECCIARKSYHFLFVQGRHRPFHGPGKCRLD